MKKVRRTKRRNRTWQLQEAKSKFSKLVDDVIEDGYHTITRNGEPVVVVIPQKEFEKMAKPKDTLIDFFKKAPFPDFDLDMKRGKDTGREIDFSHRKYKRFSSHRSPHSRSLSRPQEALG